MSWFQIYAEMMDRHKERYEQYYQYHLNEEKQKEQPSAIKVASALSRLFGIEAYSISTDGDQIFKAYQKFYSWVKHDAERDLGLVPEATF